MRLHYFYQPLNINLFCLSFFVVVVYLHLQNFAITSNIFTKQKIIPSTKLKFLLIFLSAQSSHMTSFISKQQRTNTNCLAPTSGRDSESE